MDLQAGGEKILKLCDMQGKDRDFGINKRNGDIVPSVSRLKSTVLQ